jgi:hypothetical protein
MSNIYNLDSTEAERYPEGRTLFYEGGNPEQFRQQMITSFGFDPAETPGDLTGMYDHLDNPREPTWDEKHGWAFHCPPGHLDAVRGNWPVGS